MIDDKAVTFQIIDTCNPATLPAPPEKHSDPEEMMTLPESGRGLFLIHHIMNDVSYIQSDGKNIFTMKKHLIKQT